MSNIVRVLVRGSSISMIVRVPIFGQKLFHVHLKKKIQNTIRMSNDQAQHVDGLIWFQTVAEDTSCLQRGKR